MNVRKAQPQDAAGVFALARDFATSYAPDLPHFSPAFERIIQGEDIALFVADDAGALTGYVLVQRQETLFANGPVGYVQELMVTPEHRREGIGAALMRAAEDWAFAEGCVYVGLASRRAGDFYRAAGYDESAAFFKKVQASN